jgi:tryptophan synthase alpha chain
MGRIGDRFRTLAARGEVALIPYLTAGDPDLDMTRAIVRAAEAGGADLIEIGVPFSDPMADGPTLQRAFARSLEKGTSLPRILELVADIRKHSDIPIVLFGYYNPFFRYGPERFAADARSAGTDGVLCVDLPPEEAAELKCFTDREDLDLIFLLSPTSGPQRIRKVTKVARGFVYAVAVTGVTGARAQLPEAVPSLVSRVKAVTSLPVAVGFGISAPQQAAWVASFADAVVVGSALADIIERHPDPGTLPERVESFVAGLKRGMGEARVAGRGVERGDGPGPTRPRGALAGDAGSRRRRSPGDIRVRRKG